MRCRYCGYQDGHHNSRCPKPNSSEMKIWEHGHSDGCRGKVCFRSIKELANPFYQMGWNQGALAREEAENGFESEIEVDQA